MESIKLTKAQQAVIERAKQEIDYSRNHDFRHFRARASRYDLETDWDAHPNDWLTNERVNQIVDDLVAADDDEQSTLPHWWRNLYEEEKNGIAIVIANSTTLKALERMGIIEIIRDGGSSPDKIRILNY